MAKHGPGGGWKKVAGGAIGLSALVWGYASAGAPYWPGSVELAPMTTRVVAEDIEQAILVNGVLEPAQMVSVGAQVSGQIKVLHVVLGQQVKAGDELAEIDSVPQQNALRLAEANLDLAKAQRDARLASLRQVEAAYERQKGLLEAKATSQTDFETAEAGYRGALADVAALDAQIVRSQIEVEMARTNVAYTQITAPIDGTIIAVVTKQGQTLNANQVAPTVVVIARLDQMSVKVQISEAEIAKVRVGQDVWFTLLGDDQTRFAAKLEIIEPAPQTLLTQSQSADSSQSQGTAAVYFNGMFKVDNVDGKLWPLMTARVHLVTGRAEQVPTVLSSALGPRETDGRYRVDILTADGRQSRLVRIGLDDKTNAQVIEGLMVGDQVILPLGDTVEPFDPMGVPV